MDGRECLTILALDIEHNVSTYKSYGGVERRQQRLTERERFIQVIKRSLSGWLNCHIIRKIAPMIADGLIENGAVMGKEDEGK